MQPTITPEQRDALHSTDGPLAVEDDTTHQIYFLVHQSTFEDLQQQDDRAAIRDGIGDLDAGHVMAIDALDARISGAIEST